MEFSEKVFHLIDLLAQVSLISLIVAAPIIALILLMYFYGRYKKMNEREIKEKDKILVAKANKIVEYNVDLERQYQEKKKLEANIEVLQIKEKSLQEKLGIDGKEEKDVTEDKIDLESMSIRELKTYAKENNIDGYSNKNKKQLLKLLKEKQNDEQQKRS